VTRILDFSPGRTRIAVGPMRFSGCLRCVRHGYLGHDFGKFSIHDPRFSRVLPTCLERRVFPFGVILETLNGRCTDTHRRLGIHAVAEANLDQAACATCGHRELILDMEVWKQRDSSKRMSGRSGGSARASVILTLP
jgi:hypothetical protein